MADDGDWISPELLSLGWLQADTPPGLFRATEVGNALVWIPTIGRAVRLGDDAAAFIAWQTDEDSFAYAGVHFGEVQLEIDATSISREPYPPKPGDLLFRGGQIYLVGRGDRPGVFRNPLVPVGTVSTAERFPYTASCTRWALVRGIDDSRTVAFLRDAESTESA